MSLKMSQTEAEQILAEAKRLRGKEVNNKKRSKLSGADLPTLLKEKNMTAKSLADRLKLFNSCCAYCCEPLGKNKQIDHVIPISKLGADTLDNIVYVCHSCNTSKGNRDFLTWYRSKPFWSQERESKVLAITGKLDALKI